MLFPHIGSAVLHDTLGMKIENKHPSCATYNFSDLKVKVLLFINTTCYEQS